MYIQLVRLVAWAEGAATVAICAVHIPEAVVLKCLRHVSLHLTYEVAPFEERVASHLLEKMVGTKLLCTRAI